MGHCFVAYDAQPQKPVESGEEGHRSPNHYQRCCWSCRWNIHHHGIFQPHQHETVVRSNAQSLGMGLVGLGGLSKAPAAEHDPNFFWFHVDLGFQTLWIETEQHNHRLPKNEVLRGGETCSRVLPRLWFHSPLQRIKLENYNLTLGG